MKARGILMSSAMVLAHLAGRKTQTRRLKGLEALNADPNKVRMDDLRDFISYCPYGEVGDLLYVRESFYLDNNPIDTSCRYDTVTYKADFLHRDIERRGVVYTRQEKADMCLEGWHHPDYPDREDLRWKPGIHMPKEAARIWLQLQRVGLERLSDISEKDAIAEGIEEITGSNPQRWKRYDEIPGYLSTIYPYFSYQTLFQSLHGKEMALLDPWLWVLEYRVVSITGRPEHL